MAKHTVSKGECMSSLAARFGFPSWKTIYDAPGNEALRKKRPNPNLLAVGDVVALPKREKHTSSAQTSATAALKVAVSRTELRLHLRSAQGAKLASVKCSLKIAGQTLEGTTDGDGLLKLRIPPRAIPGTLEVPLPDPPPPEKPKDDGLEVPAETFTIPDEPEHPALKVPEPKSIVWQLTLGALGPTETVTGLQNRLHNLGYRCAVDGIVGPETNGATHAFQEDRKKAVGAIDDPTRADLEKSHDNGEA